MKCRSSTLFSHRYISQPNKKSFELWVPHQSHSSYIIFPSKSQPHYPYCFDLQSKNNQIVHTNDMQFMLNMDNLFKYQFHIRLPEYLHQNNHKYWCNYLNIIDYMNICKTDHHYLLPSQMLVLNMFIEETKISRIMISC